MDAKKVADERIALRNDQQTSIAISLDRKGKTAIEPGDKILVASSAVTVLHARFNPETGIVDVVPVEGSQGPAEVVVTITLADGTVLPPQTVPYEVLHPDAEAVVLEPGAIGEKKQVIVVPLPNPEPHEVPLPVEKKAEPVKGISGAPKYAARADYKAAMTQADADFAPGGAHAGDVAARDAAYAAAAKTRDAALDKAAAAPVTDGKTEYADQADYKAAMAKADADFAPGGAHAGDLAARDAAYAAASKTRDAATKG